MSNRLFRRGELKSAILCVLCDSGPVHGYAVMAALRERIGGGWKPSPGAIYPALLALEEAGHIRGSDEGGSRLYEITEVGRRHSSEALGLLDVVAARAEAHHPQLSLGTALDDFAAGVEERSHLLQPAQQARLESILDQTRQRIHTLINESTPSSTTGAPHG